MVFTNLLTDEVIVSRLQTTTGDRMAMTTMTTSLICHIQQLSPTKTVEFGGALGKTYKLFADTTVELQNGDMLKDQNGYIYTVEAGGVRNIDNIGIAQHMEVIVKRVE